MIGEAYPYLFRSHSDIPAVIYSNLRREIGEAIGRPFKYIFPDFAKAFPLAVSSLDEHWPAPMLACDCAYGEWLVSLASETADRNIFFNLTIADIDLVGPRFEKSHKMLPLRWQELYRWFWSFVITSDSRQPLFWKNTPFSYPSRLSLEEFRQQIGGKKKAARAFEKSITDNQINLKCWMWTDAGDALFVDEHANDKKVYHLCNNNLEDTCLLNNPEDILDRYLAHFISGKSPSTFSFRV